MVTIIVTGGYGFIGSNFIRLLLEKTDYKIINIDSLTYAGNKDNLSDIKSDRLSNVQTTIDDTEFIHHCLRYDNVKYVVNFAAESHVDRSIDSPHEFFRTNVLQTLSLLSCANNHRIQEYAHPDFKFIHISTDEVYGSIEAPLSFTEESNFKPNSPYAASKASSDLLCRSFVQTYNMPLIITNCSNNYGANQHPEKLIPTIIRKCQNKEPIPIYGDGLNVRDWIFVKDHCEAILEVMDKGVLGETYNIGSNNTITNLEIVNTICEIFKSKYPSFDYKSLITFVEDRPGHDHRYAINSDKLTNVTGWLPRTNFTDGLEYTIDWYSKNSEWCANTGHEDKRLGKLE